MKIKIMIFSWRRFLAGTKHCYVKVFEDGVLKVQQGGSTDHLMFFTQMQAQDWADKYVEEHHPDEEITWEYLGIPKMTYQYSHEGD